MSRSQKMFRKLGLPLPVVQKQVPKSKKVPKPVLEAQSELSDFTPSELEFLAPKTKCISWLEGVEPVVEKPVDNSLQPVLSTTILQKEPVDDLADVSSTSTTSAQIHIGPQPANFTSNSISIAQKARLRLVDYSPSSNSTEFTASHLASQAASCEQVVSPVKSQQTCRRKLVMFSGLQKTSSPLPLAVKAQVPNENQCVEPSALNESDSTSLEASPKILRHPSTSSYFFEKENTPPPPSLSYKNALRNESQSSLSQAEPRFINIAPSPSRSFTETDLVLVGETLPGHQSTKALSCSATSNSSSASSKAGVCRAQQTKDPPNVPSPRSENISTPVFTSYAALRAKNIEENERILKELLERKTSPKIRESKARKKIKFTSGCRTVAGQRRAPKRKAAPTSTLEEVCDSDSEDLISVHSDVSEVRPRDDSDDDCDSDIVSLPSDDSNANPLDGTDSDDSSQSASGPAVSPASETSRAASPNIQEECDKSDLDSITESPVKVSSRKKKEERKIRRNCGQSYTTVAGKLVSERKRKPPHNCKRIRCQEIISDVIGDALFNEYWAMGSYDKRVQYVAARVMTTPITRSRKRDEDSDLKKEVSNSYYFEIEGSRKKVCKDTFLKTLGETDTFVRKVMEKKKLQVSGITHHDGRGTHNPKHKMALDVKNAVMAHIKSFPSYVSHYCRKDTSQKYLPSQLNLTKMYKLYIESENPTVSYSSYQRIFKTMKLKFHQPLSDTCSYCDNLLAKIKFSEGVEKEKLERERELHLRRAEKAYRLKKEMKDQASNDETKRVLVFDLEQCLPCPALNCGVVYYKRQLYTFNLTIYDTKTKLTHCYMWHEAEGGRGANEISSCLYQHILHEIPHGVTELILFSDCCSGQNRNSIVCTMFQVALQMHPSLKKIDHIFLIPGHTRMECDSKHSVIERAKKKEEVISVPSDYYKLVENAGMSDNVNFPEGKFKVVLMSSKIFNFAELTKYPNPLVVRSVATDKSSFRYMSTHWFRYDKNQPGIVMVKAAFSPEASFQSISFRRTKKATLPNLFPLLTKAYNGPVPISSAKKKDLLSLLCFIDPCHHNFYKNLSTDDDLTDTHPDLPSDEQPDDVGLEETDA